MTGNVVEEHGSKKGRVGVCVQEVESFVAMKTLFRLAVVNGKIHGSLLSRCDREERRCAAKSNPDCADRGPVHGKLSRHIDVGFPEVGQFGLPIVVLKVQEQGA